jgi:hypothetical protein
MIKITPPSKPDIIFPVARECIITKSVWIFFSPSKASCIDVGDAAESPTIGKTCDNFNIGFGWKPVDLHIIG